MTLCARTLLGGLMLNFNKRAMNPSENQDFFV